MEKIRWRARFAQTTGHSKLMAALSGVAYYDIEVGDIVMVKF